MAYDENLPVGCASYKPFDAHSAEIKRVFIRTEYRGQGISKRLMQLLEARAFKDGYDRLILETGKQLFEAMGLYRSSGFKVIPNYGKYINMIESICMEKIWLEGECSESW